MSESMKRKVLVTITKEIEIELTPAMFAGLSQEQYLQEFRDGLWPIDGIEDVFSYAASMAAHHGGGYSHDGLGLLNESDCAYPRDADVKFKLLSEETETEFVK